MQFDILSGSGVLLPEACNMMLLSFCSVIISICRGSKYL